MTVRSYRNLNPGNLRVGQPWLGLCPPAQMTPEQAAEKDFCVFKSADYGFRALSLLLLTYYRKYKLKTVYAIISRFAPSSENDTKAYASAVATHLGVLTTDPIDVENFNTLLEFSRAISIHEAGGWMFDNRDLSSGVSMALGITEPPDSDPGALVA